GTGNLTINAIPSPSGTVQLSGNNTYTGRTILTAGTLAISDDSNLGAAPGRDAPDHLTISNPATLRALSSFALNPNRGVTLNGVSTLRADTGITFTIPSAISGGGGFIKTNGGVIDLSGSSPSTYTGLTTVSAGELRLSKTGGVRAIGDAVIN